MYDYIDNFVNRANALERCYQNSFYFSYIFYFGMSYGYDTVIFNSKEGDIMAAKDPVKVKRRLEKILETHQAMSTAGLKNSEAHRNIVALQEALSAVDIVMFDKKVKHIESREFGDSVFCPTCNHKLEMVSNCCPFCGQKLTESSWK